MAKGKLIIEFDGAADLLQQLQLLVKGETNCAAFDKIDKEWKAAAYAQIMRDQVPPQIDPASVSGVRYPIAERKDSPVQEAPDTIRGVLDQPGAGMSASTDVTGQVMAHKEPQHVASAGFEQKAPEVAQPDAKVLTIDNMADFTQPELLAYCVKHGVLGVNAEKNTLPFFLDMIKMRIRTHLETVGAAK